jgi:hypothetical protein
MSEMGKRAQLALEWTHERTWEDVPAPLRTELRAVLRELLRRAARTDGAGGAHDQ